MPPFRAELIVENSLSGIRIDRFLIRHFRNYSSFRMQRIVQTGHVKIDEMTVDITQRVFAGQRVTVQLVEPPDKLLSPEPIPIDILYEDPWLLVVNKPPGLVAHPVGNFQSGTLSNAVQHYLDGQTARRGLLRPGIVHRLDRMTSGALVVAKEHLSHRSLSIQFQRERISKTYLALVEGGLKWDDGVIDLPIGQAPGGRSVLMTAKSDALAPRPARTRYEVLARFDGYTLVKAKPYTGRNHQIRVHLAEIGYPIVGDEFYGPFGQIRRPSPHRSPVEIAPPIHPCSEGSPPRTNASPVRSTTFLPDWPAERHALHALDLGFSHPITQEWLEFCAPLASDFAAAIQFLQARLSESVRQV